MLQDVVVTKPKVTTASVAEAIWHGIAPKTLTRFLVLGLPGGVMMAADACSFDVTTVMASILGMLPPVTLALCWLGVAVHICCASLMVQCISGMASILGVLPFVILVLLIYWLSVAERASGRSVLLTTCLFGTGIISVAGCCIVANYDNEDE